MCCSIAGLLATIAIVSYILDRDGKRPGAFVMTLALGMVLIMGIAARARTRRVLAQLPTATSRARCHIIYDPDASSARIATTCTRFRFTPDIARRWFPIAASSRRSATAPKPPQVSSTATRNCVSCGLRANASMLIANRKDLPTLADLSPAPVIVGCEGKKFALFNRPEARPVAMTVDPQGLEVGRERLGQTRLRL